MDRLPGPAPVTRVGRGERILLWAILGFAFAVRTTHWMAVRGEPFFAQLIVDSKEYDGWAQQIAAGDWLGSRVFFQAPLYPYILGGVYALIGRHLGAIYLLQIVAAVFGVWAIFQAGRIMGGSKAGLVAAALAAAYGPFLFYDVQILKESFAVTVACAVIWALAEARGSPSRKLWFAAGALLGVLALLRENALLLTPFLLVLVYRSDTPARPLIHRGAAFLLGVVLPLVPVAARNGLVGGDFLPTTSQGGVNFYIGNNAAADGAYRPIVPGKQIPALERAESTRVAEIAEGRKLTPAEVSSYWLRSALRWAGSHPGEFLRLQVRKLGMYWAWYEWPDAVDYYWTRTRSIALRLPLVEFSTISLLAIAGLWVLWRRRAFAVFAPAWVFALGWMLSTIIFFLFSRYRLPGVPALMLLGAMPIVALDDARRERRRWWWIGAVLVAAAFVLPFALGGKPRMDLVEFNLGRLAEDNGNPREAESHYKLTIAADPKNFLAWMNLGTIAAQRQDWPTALPCYRRAVGLEPRSDDAECNLGGVLLALGDFDEARTHLERALSLNPRNMSALQNTSALLFHLSDFAGARDLNQRLLEIDPRNQAALRMRDRLDEVGRRASP